LRGERPMTRCGVEWITERFTDAKGTTLPVCVARVRGKLDGPTLGLVAGQHGMEHTGVYVLRDLIERIDPSELRGQLLVCPAANPQALLLDYEIYPEREDLSKLDEYFYSRARHGYCVFGLGRGQGKTMYNMNRLWPGRPDAGLTGRITGWLWKTLVEPSDVVIDLHCCGNDLPHLLVPWEGHEKVIPLARYFGARWIKTPDHPTDYHRGKLHYQVNQTHRRCFTVEFSRQHEVNYADLAFGRRGLANIMRALGMLPGQATLPSPVWWEAAERQELKARHRGHILFHVGWYEPVRAGQLVCEIFDVFTGRRLDQHRAPFGGIVGGLDFRPISRPGESLCWVNDARRVDLAQLPTTAEPTWQPLH